MLPRNFFVKTLQINAYIGTAIKSMECLAKNAEKEHEIAFSYCMFMFTSF
jgi:hypothetical protein